MKSIPGLIWSLRVNVLLINYFIYFLLKLPSQITFIYKVRCLIFDDLKLVGGCTSHIPDHFEDSQYLQMNFHDIIDARRPPAQFRWIGANLSDRHKQYLDKCTAHNIITHTENKIWFSSDPRVVFYDKKFFHIISLIYCFALGIKIPKNKTMRSGTIALLVLTLAKRKCHLVAFSSLNDGEKIYSAASYTDDPKTGSDLVKNFHDVEAEKFFESYLIKRQRKL